MNTDNGNLIKYSEKWYNLISIKNSNKKRYSNVMISSHCEICAGCGGCCGCCSCTL